LGLALSSCKPVDRAITPLGESRDDFPSTLTHPKGGNFLSFKETTCLQLAPKISIKESMLQDNRSQQAPVDPPLSPAAPLLLIIDSEKTRGQKIADFLESQGFRVELGLKPSFASLSEVARDKFLIVIWNVGQFPNPLPPAVKEWKRRARIVSLILLTQPDPGQADLKAVSEGWIDQLVSPEHWSALLAAVRSEIDKERYRRELSQVAGQLKRIKQDKARSLRRAAELEGIYNATLENLMTALDLRDVETFGHSRVVARYSQALAQILGITDNSRIDYIRQGALLHDVGKIAIPDSILKKPDRLTAEEWEKIKLHPTLGYGLVKEIKLVETVGHIILYHHERFDGQGYPFGLKKDNIPLEARIFALADSLDAITSHRPYRQERDFRAARLEIISGRGYQFDPKIVDAFCSLELEAWEKIRYETAKISPALEKFRI